MTAQLLNPATTSYTISGIGPYTIDHAYDDEADITIIAIGNDGTVTVVPASDYTISPTAPAVAGDVTLSVGAASQHNGKTMMIERVTSLEQGWAGTTAREDGLEAQLDRMTFAIQESQRDARQGLRVYGQGQDPLYPRDGSTIVWDASAGAWVNGPSLETLANTQAIFEAVTLSETQAVNAAAAAEASALAAAAVGGDFSNAGRNLVRNAELKGSLAGLNWGGNVAFSGGTIFGQTALEIRDLSPATWVTADHVLDAIDLDIHSWLRGKTVTMACFGHAAPGVTLVLKGAVRDATLHHTDLATSDPFDQAGPGLRKVTFTVPTDPAAARYLALRIQGSGVAPGTPSIAGQIAMPMVYVGSYVQDVQGRTLTDGANTLYGPQTFAGGGHDEAHPILGALHLWADSQAQLRMKNGAPSGDLDGALLYHMANILGVVSGNGAGANTGAIVEAGRSGSTVYVKFAGGIAICARRFGNNASGTEIWNLPFPFSDTERMVCAATYSSLGSARTVAMQPTSLTTVEVFVRDSAGAPQSARASGVCIGFWSEEFI